MARVELAPEIAGDVDRILDHLATYEVQDAAARIQDIVAALSVLERNPRIGRPARGATRELIIGKAAWGYVALYRYVPEIDTVFVLAIRHQSEAGYAR